MARKSSKNKAVQETTGISTVETPGERIQDTMFSELLDLVKIYNTDENDLQLLEKAYRFADDAHKMQLRKSKEPYITHPLQVAMILARLRLDVSTIVAAILHDTVEDNDDIQIANVEELFSKEIAGLVDGVTKLSAITDSQKQAHNSQKSGPRMDKQAENLKKVFLAMARDVRVILIKVADRLHNMRTLGAITNEEKRKNKARETLEFFAPIAGRLGMWEFKWHLEDLAFKYLYPREYEQLVKEVAARRKDREDDIESVKEIIKKALDEVGLTNAHIDGRPKHLYSIFQKMNKKECTLEEVYDLTAVRIILGTVKECYQALGIIHNLKGWKPIHDRFKDYIAMPKSNNYRSLHTTLYRQYKEPLEVQIRTREMHRVDEFGIAAHWSYKEGGNVDVNMTSEISPWIRKILDFSDESKDARGFVENLKLNLLQNDVFVFTPRGEVIDLPAGSTPIDFAYTIHTEVGHRCIGAKVNSKIVPLEYKLKNSDIVEILTSKHGSPSRDWLKICKSHHAKNKIRQWFRKERREENLERGKDMVEKELKKRRIEISLNNSDIFGKIAKKYNFQSIDDLFVGVGYGETSPITVINRVQALMDPELLPAKPAPPPEAEAKKAKRSRKSKSLVQVQGIENLMIKFAKCCTPLRGDDIIGYVTLGKGVSVHRANCPNFAILASRSQDRVVKVFWSDEQQDATFSVQMAVEAWDRPGLLSEVMELINERKIHINSAHAWAKGSEAVIKIVVNLRSREQMDELINGLRKVKGVTKVYRMTRKNM